MKMVQLCKSHDVDYACVSRTPAIEKKSGVHRVIINEFAEVPSYGLYCMKFKPADTVPEKSPHNIHLILWTHLCLDSMTFPERDAFSINSQHSLTHNIASLNTVLPEIHYSISPTTNNNHLGYLNNLLQNNPMFSALANTFIDVLQDAVTIRVVSIPKCHRIHNRVHQQGYSKSDLQKTDPENVTKSISCDMFKHHVNVQHTPENYNSGIGSGDMCAKDGVRKRDAHVDEGNIEHNAHLNSEKVMKETEAIFSGDMCVGDSRVHVNEGHVEGNIALDNSKTVVKKMEGICSGHRASNEEHAEGSIALDNRKTDTEGISPGGKEANGSVEGVARVAVLFSGGIDSAVIAALTHRCLPPEEPVDLLNVAFEQRPKSNSKGKTKKVDPKDVFAVPDRLTGLQSLSDLPKHRKWNFVQINVTVGELQSYREDRVRGLIYPLNTVLDDSIGCALWCAARGHGSVLGDNGYLTPYHSTAKVVLVGMGADEQLAGYSRHRSTFGNESWEGLLREVEMEVGRISARNLGRDDRIISDHGRESRYPFLDERVMSFLNTIPIHHKCDLSLPRGLGEKLLLRLAAVRLGLCHAAVMPKRAIQFGSRIAKLENAREKASQVCDRLTADKN